MKSTTIRFGREAWTLVVRAENSPMWVFTARGTEYTMYVLPQSDGNYFVGILELNRCGSVPYKPVVSDIKTYCGVTNTVDALNVVAALALIMPL